MPADTTIIQGTLDALILKTLTWGPNHGFGIARWIRDTSDALLTVEDRALYLALHRLEAQGWVEAEWGLSENKRRAKYYRLTTPGRRHLRAEVERLTGYSAALVKVLRTSPPEPGR